jgi:hypothetical protein
MSVYTVPALNAVNFALEAHSFDITSPQQALASYTVPALNAVAFALTVYAAPAYMDLGWELLPDLSFPFQYGFLHFQDGTDKQLCVVAEGDANVGEGLRIRHGGVTYAIYIVDTTDPNASNLRFEVSTGTRAIRLKT